VKIYPILSGRPLLRLTSLVTGLAGFLALATTAEAGTTYSKVWSMSRMFVPSNSDQWISVSGHAKTHFLGRIQSISGSTLQVAGAPGWAANAYTAGGTVGACYIKALSGADEGACFPIVSNGADSVSLGTSLNAPVASSLAVGDYIAVIPNWTLASWTDKPADLTRFYLLNRSSTGINNGAVYSTDYYGAINPATGQAWGWFEGSQDINGRTLEVDEVLTVRNIAATAFIHTQSGEISLTRHYRRLESPVAGAEQDHYLTFSGATPQAIGDLPTLPQDGDQVYFFDASLAGINKGATYSATYYAAINAATGQPWGWYAGAVDVNATEFLVPGTAVLYRQSEASGGTTRAWTDLPDYL